MHDATSSHGRSSFVRAFDKCNISFSIYMYLLGFGVHQVYVCTAASMPVKIALI